MSANILRASIRRNAVISNKRFYATTPASEQPVKPGPGSSGLLLGVAAVGVSYYLYRRSVDVTNKSPIEKRGDVLEGKYKDSKENITGHAIDEAKAKYEQLKTDASQTVSNKVDAVKSKYEEGKADVSQAVSNKVDEAKSKYEEGKADVSQAVSNKVDEAKSKYEEGKADASAKANELAKEGTDKYETAKDIAAQKGEQVQKNVGDKVTDAGKSIKDNA